MPSLLLLAVKYIGDRTDLPFWFIPNWGRWIPPPTSTTAESAQCDWENSNTRAPPPSSSAVRNVWQQHYYRVEDRDSSRGVPNRAIGEFRNDKQDKQITGRFPLIQLPHPPRAPIEQIVGRERKEDTTSPSSLLAAQSHSGSPGAVKDWNAFSGWPQKTSQGFLGKPHNHKTNEDDLSFGATPCGGVAVALRIRLAEHYHHRQGSETARNAGIG